MSPSCTDTSFRDQLFFDRAYTFAPIIQANRYRSWSKQPQRSRRKIALQYAMWTVASSLSSHFQSAGRQLYIETKQALNALDSEEPQQQISIEQAQAWLLLAMYEITCDDYQRGMMSAGKAFRLIQMMRLYEIDAQRPLVPLTTQKMERDQDSPNLQERHKDDWVDTETKRRTFWLAYTIDRFTSMVDGLHSFINEPVIRTRLPSSETRFASGRSEEMKFLDEMLSGLEWSESDLSPFMETIIGATICGRALQHKQSPPAQTLDATYEFCRGHRSLNTLLAQRFQVLLMHTPLECLDPVRSFTALAERLTVLILYDLLQSKPLGSDPQATQLTKALLKESHQQSLDAVHDSALLIATLGQQFQAYPLTPILLLLGARFSQAHPELNDAYNKLVPPIVTTLQAPYNQSRLSRSFLQLLTADQP